MNPQGKLILLPNFLHEEGVDLLKSMPSCLSNVVGSLDGVVCESEKGARLFLKCFTLKDGLTFRNIPLKLLNEHTESKEQIRELLEPIRKGEVWGVLSDAGMPCLADPGSSLVDAANQENLSVEVYMGPTSIILALLLSGFSAQSFSFHGYLPRDVPLLKKRFLELKLMCQKSHQTQVFIEAPYRNDKTLEILLESLDPFFRVAIAVDLGGKDQKVIVKTVAALRKEKSQLNINKRPAVFLFSC